MKNPHLERMRRKMRQYHRHHPWGGLDGGLFIPHLYPETKANRLSWWDDVGFILNGRRVLVQWIHPRRAYLDAIEQQAFDEVQAPRTPGPLEKRLGEQRPGTNGRKPGRSFKKGVGNPFSALSDEWVAFFDAVNAREDELARSGIDLEIIPSMRLGLCPTATTMDLVVPMEIRCKADIRALAGLAKRLIKRETTVAEQWPSYRYGREAWLEEAGLRPHMVGQLI